MSQTGFDDLAEQVINMSPQCVHVCVFVSIQNNSYR